MLRSEKTDDGCTALIAIVIYDCLYIAWLGDSRAVLCTGADQQARALSVDHKPNDRKVCSVLEVEYIVSQILMSFVSHRRGKELNWQVEM